MRVSDTLRLFESLTRSPGFSICRVGHKCATYEDILGTHFSVVNNFSSVVSCVCLETLILRAICGLEVCFMDFGAEVLSVHPVRDSRTRPGTGSSFHSTDPVIL